MIILKQQTTPHTINAILDGGAGTTIVLRDEETNIVTTLNATFTSNSYYSTAVILLPLIDGKTYTITIKNGADVVYKDKIFCTNQTIADYTINKDQYIQHTTNNEYTIYE
jgi:hypothetical protein